MTFLYTLVVVTTLQDGTTVITEHPAAATTKEACDQSALEVRRVSGDIAYCSISGEIK